MLTKNILNKGGEESWRVDVVRLVGTAMKWVGRCKSGNKPDTHYSSSMRFFLMSFERGGQSGDCLGGSPLWIMILPSGRWQDNQTPTIAFTNGTPLASVTLVWCLQGCIIACKSTYGGMHIESVLIIHHFFERHFAIGFSDSISMSTAKKIFRPMAQP